MSENNPFFSVSLLPYQAPRFDLIDVSHYRPAFDEGVRRQRAEIAEGHGHKRQAGQDVGDFQPRLQEDRKSVV